MPARSCTHGSDQFVQTTILGETRARARWAKLALGEIVKGTLATLFIAGGIFVAAHLQAQAPADNQKWQRSQKGCEKADSLNRAVQRGCVDKVREFLAANGIDSKDGSQSEALTTAIRSGNKEIVEILIRAGAPLNPPSTVLWPPLSDAAFAKQLEIMKLLLQSGAKVDALDHRGATLLVSTGFFDPNVTTILLESGADPNARDREGATALMRASGYGLKQSVSILIDGHADVNLKDAKGRTALMHAAAGRLSSAIPLLLENGADPNLRDDEGKSALDIADHYNNLGAFTMLSVAVKRSHQ